MTGWLALGVSFVTVFAAIWAAQAAAYQRIHESLVNIKCARGRKAAFQAQKTQNWPEQESEEWDSINQALAMYDTLGVYYRCFYVPPWLVLQHWSHPVISLTPAVRGFMEYRESLGVVQRWKGLETLIKACDRWGCRCDDCKKVRAELKSSSEAQAD